MLEYELVSREANRHFSNPCIEYFFANELNKKWIANGRLDDKLNDVFVETKRALSDLDRL